jgi:hypothetical protein
MGPLFDTSDRLATVTRWFLRAEQTITEDEQVEEE